MEIVDCAICSHPRVVGINSDLIKGFPFNRICERNNLEYSNVLVKQLLKHRKSHINTPSMALARQMLHDEAINLKNTAVEVNVSLDQIDILAFEIFENLEITTTIDEKHKLLKNFADLLKRKYEFLGMLNKMSGKDLQDELKRASLTEVIKRVSKEVGDRKIKEIKEGNLKTDRIESFIMQDPYINSLYKDLEDGANKKSGSDTYEVESE